jgi:ABC-2 type transport system ATP-binding protein
VSEDFAIETESVTKSYGSNTVLDGVDLRVSRGSVFALLGPNGAGKTTAVRILSTLLEPDRGRARVAGYDVVAQRREVRRRISLTGQYAALDELQTGRENLEMIGRLLGLSGAAASARARELLTAFELTDAGDRRAGSYSGGMRRRLDLGCSLIAGPEVIFLDEPTTGLDPRSRQAMWELIRALAASAVTVFLTTQYLEEADLLADRIALLDGGRIVAEGTAAELKRAVGGERLELRFAGADAFALAVQRLGSGALDVDRGSLSVSVATRGAAGEVRALLDELDPDRTGIADFAIRRASLNDVFMTLTGHRSGAPTIESETTYA